MRKLLIVALAFAFLAAPIGALCSSCCPKADSGQRMGAAMPCCGEGCAPKVASAKPSSPAVTVERVSLDPPCLPLDSLTSGLLAWAVSASLDPFASPSPPIAFGPPSSILRL